MGPICTGCMKHPSELEEYVEVARELGMTPEDYVLEEEGTLNPENGHFLCTYCYVKAGVPSMPGGWVAP